MNSGFYPIVLSHRPRIQTESQQLPFYFGGSSVPNNLNLLHSHYSGSGFLKPQLLKKFKTNNLDIYNFRK